MKYRVIKNTFVLQNKNRWMIVMFVYVLLTCYWSRAYLDHVRQVYIYFNVWIALDLKYTLCKN